MNQTLGALTFLVDDYDRAIDFFTQILGFDLIEDTPLEAGKRWVQVAPRGGSGTRLLLAKAVGQEQSAGIGNQGGGRVFLFLNTSDFWSDYRLYQSRGLRFLEEPRVEAYGTVAVFQDIYGNKWDLLELKPCAAP